MIIDNLKISVFCVSEDIKKMNLFIEKDIKAYDFMSKDWYHYDINNSFWKSIEGCVRDTLPNYTLWNFEQSILEDTKINRLKGIAKSYIRDGERTGEYRGYVEMRDNELEFVSLHKHTVNGTKQNKTVLRFFTALECTHGGIFNNCVDYQGYFLLLPKNIQEEKIVTFLKNWKSVNNTSDKNILEVNIDIYNFLIDNKGILIEEYNDSKYYEYKGEEYGYIIIDPFDLCHIDCPIPPSQ